MFVDWTVLFLAAWIPRFEGFVFDDKFGVFWTFDISSHVLISLKHVHPMFVNWRKLFLSCMDSTELSKGLFLMINAGMHGFHSSKKLFLIINLEFPAHLTFLAIFES